MGCDIHFVLEKKHNDHWIGIFSTGSVYGFPINLPYGERSKYAPILTLKDRDYGFFGALAGVRTPGPDPLDLPDDTSDMTNMEAEGWGSDGHSHSYCSLRDFVLTKFKVREETAATAMRAKIEGEDPVLNFLKLHPDDEEACNLDNYRVVYWFDN